MSKNEYMRKYMRERYHAKRQGIIKLLGGQCSMCGSTDDLEIDHIDSSKKNFRSADIHSVSSEKLQNEIDNLQLLCSKCHKEKTLEKWDFSAPKPTHGKYWTYRKYKCRCDECTNAYKESVKKWREKSHGSGV